MISPEKFPASRAAVLGAGLEQMPAIRMAQECGVHVLALDRDPSAPGLAIADAARVVDPANAELALEACRDAGVNFLLPTPMGALLEVAGQINEKLGLPGIRCEAARLCADKLAMRRRLAEAGLRQPIFHELTDCSEIVHVAAAMGWPVVIKPRFGSGSHGVVVLDCPADVKAHIEWHRQHAGRGGAHASTLIEECIEGPEFGMDAVMTNGRFQMICLRRKEVTALPFRLALGVSTPPELAPWEITGLSLVADCACRALGLDDCLVHVDLILESGTGHGIVIELSGRPSGFRISSHFVPQVKGFEPVREMIRYYQGFPAEFSARIDRAGVMRIKAPYASGNDPSFTSTAIGTP